ncbi:Crp/Fnr family transcriptional regulator [Chryseobacterium defluvii]|uniref:CRP-like cAMP-binding protein n=1 Tax=Chryseobacterium defluvii TaxID=160396 RepID=A0A495S9B4_9FLAO|nr:Crp/Fnr family transcriptional regulator [Chryseobacterium defluvii]RKS96101.1 CRP-like cAMP-binding protein [Chryseobacterium defluvii]
MESTQLIDHFSKYIQLNTEEVELIHSLFSYKSLKKKEFLLRSGDICRTESFIISGCLRTFSIDENGFEHTLTFAIEDWWTGDLLSFFTETSTSYNIVALEDSEILQITKTDLDKLYLKVPKLERYFRQLIQNAYVAQQQRIDQNLSQTAEQRYLSFVEKYPVLLQRIPQKHIASYLGITPVFLSMLRKKLSQR